MCIWLKSVLHVAPWQFRQLLEKFKMTDLRDFTLLHYILSNYYRTDFIPAGTCSNSRYNPVLQSGIKPIKL